MADSDDCDVRSAEKAQLRKFVIFAALIEGAGFLLFAIFSIWRKM